LKNKAFLKNIHCTS